MIQDVAHRGAGSLLARVNVSAARQLIAGFEVSINCRFWVSTEVKYPRAHEWPAEGKAFAEIAREIRTRQLIAKLAAQHLEYTIRLPRLLLLLNFWAQFYLTAKYGFEAEHMAAARDLFDMKDAELAVLHAEECWRAAVHVNLLPEDVLTSIVSDTSAKVP